MGPVTRRLPNGLEVDQIDPGEAALLYREIFVERSYLRDGFPRSAPEVIFDIGANIGLASIFFKQRYPEAFIVAVEPGPDTYRALRANFDRHVPDGTTRNVAVTERRGRARFGYYPSAPAESGFFADADADAGLAARLLTETGVPAAQAERFARSRHQLSHVDCETVTLSELIDESGVDRVDLVKIDVEKSEQGVLAGINERDWARIGSLVVEVHDIDDRLARVARLLLGHGFEVASLQEGRLTGTDMHMIFANRGR